MKKISLKEQQGNQRNEYGYHVKGTIRILPKSLDRFSSIICPRRMAFAIAAREEKSIQHKGSDHGTTAPMTT